MSINKVKMEETEEIGACEAEWQNAQEINFRLDLVSASRAELEFLHLVDRTPALQNRKVLERAVDRYFENWLPLVSSIFESHSTEVSVDCYLLPPIDCAWIWHCHKLNPVQYDDDCQQIYGKLFDLESLLGQEPFDSERRKLAEQFSIQRWETTFADSEEPYHLIKPFEDGTSPDFQQLLEKKKHASQFNPGRLRHDLISAAQRQAPFYYQVSPVWFRDNRFLETALQRYKGFLHLIRKGHEDGSRRFYVPTYDIDLLWHSHQLAPSSYSKDMNDLLGMLLDHDAKDSHRSPGQKLNTGFLDTCEMWFKTFGRVYEQAGAMYRQAPKPAPPPPPIPEAEEQKLLQFTEKGQWNPSSFDQNLINELVTMKLDNSNVRSVMQVNLVILGAKDIPPDSTDTVTRWYIKVAVLAKCPMLDLRTKSKRLDPSYSGVAWNEGLSLEAVEGTQGLRLELRGNEYHRLPELAPSKFGCFSLKASTSRKESKPMLAPTEWPQNSYIYGYPVLGKVEILWSDILNSDSGLSITKWSPIISERTVSNSSVPQIHFHVSLAPPAPAPKLFRQVRAPVTDDNGHTVALLLKHAPGEEPQVGRWITKLVVNHLGETKFVVRTRSRTDHKVQPLIEMDPMEKRSGAVVHVHEGPLEASQVKSVIFGSARQLMKSDFHIINKDNIHHWSLFEDGAILAVSKTSKEDLMEMDIQIYGKCGAYPMELLPGTRLEFEEENSVHRTTCLTLVRYTPDFPQGTATAHINLETASIAVMPGESAVLVLLISSAIYSSFYDFNPNFVIDTRGKWRVEDKTSKVLGFNEGPRDGNIDSISLHNRGLSRQWGTIDTSRIPKALVDRHQEYSGKEMQGKLFGHPAACAGAACGGNKTHCSPRASFDYRNGGRGSGCGPRCRPYW